MSKNALIAREGLSAMIEVQSHENEERSFGEFRRKVRSAEVLSAATQRLLQSIHFTGRLSVIVQNGQVLKSGYEEGYFRQSESGAPARLQ
jgi:hypothetical protein